MDLLRPLSELEQQHSEERHLLFETHAAELREMEERHETERRDCIKDCATSVSFELASAEANAGNGLLVPSPPNSPDYSLPSQAAFRYEEEPDLSDYVVKDEPQTSPDIEIEIPVPDPDMEPIQVETARASTKPSKRRMSGIPRPKSAGGGANATQIRRSVSQPTVASSTPVNEPQEPQKPPSTRSRTPPRIKAVAAEEKESKNRRRSMSGSDANPPPSTPAPPPEQIGGAAADISYNVDKRTQRKMDSRDFQNAITKWRDEQQSEALNTIIARAGKVKTSNTAVVIRMRPQFKHEKEQEEFPVVTCLPGDGVSGVAVHQCGEKIVAGRGMVKHLGNFVYPCQQIFDDETESDLVYQEVGAPLLSHCVNGGVATCFMYGQTGSGKTHTMTAIQKMVSKDIFESTGESVWLAYFELIGKRCYDLLDEGHKEVFLKEGADSKMHVSGAAEIQVSDAAELTAAMKAALGRRETASTGANATSSRSHAVCRIRVGDGENRGMLNLVDLAGSERKHDSMYHDADRRRECSEINSSLMALKECIRYRALQANDPSKTVHVPYRGSSLTRVLKDSLDSPTAFTTVIATASPCASDTEHTMCTFDTVSRLTGLEKAITERQDEVETWTPPVVELVAPTKWDPKTLKEWLAQLPSKYEKCVAKVPKSMNGKQFMQLSVERLGQMMDLRSLDMALAHQIYNKIRAEAKKVQDQVDDRRRQIVDDINRSKHVASSFQKSFAPKGPGS